MSSQTTCGADVQSPAAQPLVPIGNRARSACGLAPRTVTLVALGWTRPGDPRLPLGHASIEAALRASNIRVTPVVRAVDGLATDDDLIEQIVSLGSDVIAIGVYVWNDDLVRRILPALKRRTHAEIVLGGPQITWSDPDALSATYPDADTFVRGAGEHALRDILTMDRRARIEGVSRGQEVTRSLATVDVRALASPLLDGIIEVQRGAPMLRWETSRGCPYSCAFCAHHGAPVARGIDRRDRSILRREIELIVDRRVQRLNVLDPVFNADPRHALWVLDELIAAHFGGRVTFQCSFRALRGPLVPAILDRLAKLNVEVEFGLQTTDDVVSAVISRRSEREIAAEVVAELRRRGIPFLVTIIYGLPRQTLASFKATIVWCREHRVPRVLAYPLSLLIGTKLWHDRDRLALVEGRTANQGPVPVVVETPSMTRADIEEAASLAEELRGEPLPSG